MIECVNVFFVPLVALYMLYKRRDSTPKFSPTLIMEYGIVTVAILIATKIIYTLICIIYPMEWYMGNVTYTIMAVVAAVLLVLLWGFLKKYISIKVHVKENEEK